MSFATCGIAIELLRKEFVEGRGWSYAVLDTMMDFFASLDSRVRDDAITVAEVDRNLSRLKDPQIKAKLSAHIQPYIRRAQETVEEGDSYWAPTYAERKAELLVFGRQYGLDLNP